MTSDDRFDEVLQEAAREHNSAPETPRAEMWAAIAAARGAARPASSGGVVPGGQPERPAVRVLPFTARQRRALGLVTGLAATLLVGVLIGRQTATHPASQPPQATSGAPTMAPTAAASADAPSGGTGPVIPFPIQPSVALNERGSRAMPNGRPAVAAADATAPLTTRSGRAVDAGALTPYRVATMQHLVATEALLVALRTDARAGRTDTTIATWAGDLLGTTRLLIDSPAAKDPQLKQLLDDLELVLAQISRLPGAHGEAADLGIIDDAVRHRQIITRLRALSPET